MGSGSCYKCKKCGEEYYTNTGIGMFYPIECEETVKEAKSGKLGLKWKLLMESKK